MNEQQKKQNVDYYFTQKKADISDVSSIFLFLPTKQSFIKSEPFGIGTIKKNANQQVYKIV